MTFHKILVALDISSPEVERVFQEALKVAKTEGSNLMLFHCISWENEEKINPLAGIGTLGNVNLHTTLKQFSQASWTEQVKQVRSQLQRYCDTAKSQGISVEYQYQVGNPSALICEQAKDWNADLVIVGRRNRMKWSEFLLKSVSSSVLHHASCSVFVIQTETACTKNQSASQTQPVYN
ncbi:universal stress protein [Limnoraphis robusta]|uniref:Universal stress protein n=1 Tax=Limnoraphis robusta CCNP1315 TaxID=3110306 RepID=A0ABU5U4T8_9CYAN|nr:universal stress protein [Limnoraphis robusta]MEA5521907.1 universal stress protein [Limnoraphis robusta CCNP1315]MEA5545317.1 universal stress protein [Limnoraphis robusta CCNP1324]